MVRLSVFFFQTPKECHTGTERSFLRINEGNQDVDLPDDYAVMPAFPTKLVGA